MPAAQARSGNSEVRPVFVFAADANKLVVKQLLSEEQIREGVSRLAAEVARRYGGRPLTVVGVLTGSLVLLADLIRLLDLPLRVGVIQTRSYRGAATLPGALDIEYGPRGHACYGLSKARMVRWITAFTTEYKRLTTRHAVIYTTADWWKRCTGNTKKFSSTNALWAARWGTKTPGKLPGGWKVATFWQYSSNPIDQNKFYSNRANLTKFANGD